MKVYKILTEPYIVICKYDQSNLWGFYRGINMRGNLSINDGEYFLAAKCNNGVLVFNDSTVMNFRSVEMVKNIFKLDIKPLEKDFSRDMISKFNEENLGECKIIF